MKEIKVEITEREEKELRYIAGCLSALASYQSGFNTKVTAEAIFGQFIKDMTAANNTEEKMLISRWLDLICCKIAV